MTSSVPDPLVGRTIGQYQILARIGGGGMGVVYTARASKLGRVVALKFLPSQWSDDDTAKQRFVREAQAASATNHPNICTIHDIETADDGQLFIVMAYYEGETLKKRLESGPLPIDQALDIATQVADGLAKAHAQGVVHRDIKPGNLILTEDGVRILDFGLATFADALRLTAEHAPVGTVAYMSPEQVRGLPADARSDVWAVGAVLYEMLTGHPPFRGSHAEAVSYAIRNESPPPIRGERPEVAEEIEQLVFRALHKEPSVRYATGRELARALRQMRGQSVPSDLRTGPVTQGEVPAQLVRGQTHRRMKWAFAATLAGLVLAIVMAYALFAPIARVRIIIVPVVNQTGSAELDTLRLALTYELTTHLADSDIVRVLPYQRMLPLIRRFRASGGDVSSLASIERLAKYGGAQTIAVPTLLYENRRWKARIELTNARTGVLETTLETEPQASSLVANTSEALISALADRLENHVASAQSMRVRVSARLRQLNAVTTAGRDRLYTSPETAAAFEQGLNAYSLQEYATAARFFGTASNDEAANPLVNAWRSRVLQLMRRDAEAVQASASAVHTLAETSPPRTRLLVEAIAAESRKDANTAETRYRALAMLRSDDADATLELGDFLDRQGRNNEALDVYMRVLTLDPLHHAVEVDLCRIYNRLGQSLKARDWGTRARSSLHTVGDDGEEAQALLCLADSLRSGNATDLQAARDAASEALRLFDSVGAEYNIPRVYNYLATIAGMQRSRVESLRFGEHALETAKRAGNTVIQALVLMNLGVTSNALARRATAAEFYQQSAALYRALGDAGRAAEIQANRGALFIEFGPDPNHGLREVNNALEVARSLHNDDFEVFCLYVIAGYLGNAGRRQEADQSLNQALAIARRLHLDDKVALIGLRSGRIAFDAADYATAAQRLTEVAQANDDAATRAEALLELSRVHTRMGAFERAHSELEQAFGAQPEGDARLAPRLQLAKGELVYDMNRSAESLAFFEEAAKLWRDDLPDLASVESRGYAGFLRALAGRADGREAVEMCRDHAIRMGRLPLQARCSIFLARLDVEARHFRSALASADALPGDDGSRKIGAELRAQVHYWRGRALAGLGNSVAAQNERQTARMLIEAVRASLPQESRDSFGARPDIRRITE